MVLMNCQPTLTSIDFDWSAVVALIAVISGVVLQLITLRKTTQTSEKSLAQTQQNILLTIAAEQFRHLEENLSADIANYVNETYWCDQAYRQAMAQGEAWPGTHADRVEKEWLVFNRIRVRLNPANPNEQALLNQLDAIRNTQNPDLWVTRCGRLVEAFQVVLREWRTRLGLV